MSARQSIIELQQIIQDTVNDLIADRVDFITAGIYLATLQANLRRLQAEGIEIE